MGSERIEELVAAVLFARDAEAPLERLRAAASPALFAEVSARRDDRVDTIENDDGMGPPPEHIWTRPFAAGPDLDRVELLKASLRWTPSAAELEELEVVPFAERLRLLVRDRDGEPSLQVVTPPRARLERGLGERREVRRLRFGQRRLEALPDDLGDLAELRALHLGNLSELRSLPASFARLVGLEELHVWWCGFEAIPEVVFSLPRLRLLKLDGGGEHPLPEAVGDAPALEELHLVAKDLKTLPAAIGRARTLRSLTVHAWAFERLPDEVGELHRLESLRIISARSLEEPPSTLTKLRRLTTVSIGDWNLPTAPSVLLQMPWLRTVTIFARVRMDPASERALRGALPSCEVSVRYVVGVKG